MVSFDPTIAFSLLTLLVPCQKAGSLEGIFSFLICPGMIILYVTLIGVTFWAGRGKQVKLSPKDRRIANWYLCNGAVFHIFMDGLTGEYGLGGILTTNYRQLDARFLMEPTDPTIWICVNCEIFIMAPLCFALYRAIHQGLPSRRPLELIVCTLHLFGLIFFCGCEILQGCVHIPSHDPVGGKNGPCLSNINWTENQFTFFWFGFVICNLVWLFTPLYLLKSSFDHIVHKQKESYRAE